MSAIRRAVTGIQAVVSDPVERRAYLSRLKFLAKGTEGVQAWSLEYRSGLGGRFAVPAERLAPDDECVIRCPADCLTRSPLAHLYEPRFVYRLSDTITSTSSGATHMCGSLEPPFFVRESIAWPFESVLAHGLEVPEVDRAERELGGPLTVFPTTRNYYHWLVEELPLVLRAREAVPDTGLLSFAPGITDRHRTVAQHLSVPLIESPLVVRLHDQVLPGRASDSFFVHPDDLERLRRLGASLARENAPRRGAYPDRLYVSRARSRRPLADEDRLERLLADSGFAVVYLEQTPWIEQIHLFRNADVVVGPHGAGLANLVFSAPGTTVVELTVGYMYNRCFEWVSHVAGHDYLPIEADSLPARSTPEALFRQIIAGLP